MVYSYGQIVIKKDVLHNFLKSLPKGKYGTTELIEKFKKTSYCVQKVYPSESWNANFGKILSQCSEDNIGKTLIRLDTQQRQTTDLNGNPTTEAVWEII